MKRRLIIRPEAESDIIDAVDWYESREPGLGLQVTAELHAAIERTIEYPRAYQLIRRQPRFADRLHIVSRFASFTLSGMTQ